MGLLAGQETTIKNGNKELYDMLWNKNMEMHIDFILAICYNRAKLLTRLGSIEIKKELT